MAKKLSESQIVLDSIRRIVKTLRTFSKYTEKELGLSSAQIFILQKLHDSGEPLSINELAEISHTHQSSVSVVVSKLVDRGLVEKIPDPNDSRSVMLKIARPGTHLLEKSPISIQERITKALAKMSAKDRKALVEGLQLLVANSDMNLDTPPMLLEDDER